MDRDTIIAVLTIFGAGAIPAMFVWRGQRDKTKGDTVVAQMQAASVTAMKHAEIESTYVTEVMRRLDRVEDRAQKNEERWQLRLSEVEKALTVSNSQNDSFILRIAEQNATIQLLTAQLAQIQGDLAQQKAREQMVITERDSLQQQLVEARRRISDLEFQVAALKSPGLVNIQQENH